MAGGRHRGPAGWRSASAALANGQGLRLRFISAALISRRPATRALQAVRSSNYRGNGGHFPLPGKAEHARR